MKCEYYRRGQWHIRVDDRTGTETYVVRVQADKKLFDMIRIDTETFNQQIVTCEQSDRDKFDAVAQAEKLCSLMADNT